MSDEATNRDTVELDLDTVLEEAASVSLWSKCKWFLALVVPAGLLFGLVMVLNSPEKAAEIPVWVVLVFCVVLVSGAGCVFLIPLVAHLTAVRMLMVRKQPDHGWGKSAASAAIFTIVLLLWLGAILTPFVYRNDIGLANFLLATLLGAGICLAVFMLEMAFALFGFLLFALFATVGKRFAKRVKKDDIAER